MEETNLMHQVFQDPIKLPTLMFWNKSKLPKNNNQNFEKMFVYFSTY